MLRTLSRSSLAALAMAAPLTSVDAHPHVFVDGGIDFVVDDNILSALQVTWRYDAFETLYILASHGLSLNDNGDLDDADLQTLIRQRSEFPPDFDGSAHLTVDGAAVPLEWPSGFDAQLAERRLEVTFTRELEQPIELTVGAIEVAFYESTYFFDFSITDSPDVIGGWTCTANVIPFTPDPDDAALMAVLAKLNREETSDIENVGVTFADRITLECA